jgi:DNA-binding transcriptional LysR family regulator
MSDFEGLRTFVTAANSGSFTAAARVLGITPAMVGRRIRMLEQQYGMRFIERTTRAQHITEAGQTFLVKAEAVLDAAAELDGAMGAPQGRLAGRIRMTAPATLGVLKLAATVAHFQDTNPLVTVDMILSDRRLDLVAEGFDFAVRIGELQNSTLMKRPIGTYRLILIAAPDYIARHGAPSKPEDLLNARCLINLNMMPRNHWQFVREGQTEAAVVEGGLRTDSAEALRVAALEGAGIAYLPLHMVQHDIVDGRLLPVMQEWEMIKQPINFVYPSRHQPSRVTALMKAIGADLEGLL